jgi:hypothetical protein
MAVFGSSYKSVRRNVQSADEIPEYAGVSIDQPSWRNSQCPCRNDILESILIRPGLKMDDPAHQAMMSRKDISLNQLQRMADVRTRVDVRNRRSDVDILF